jgi:hypothetical protein
MRPFPDQCRFAVLFLAALVSLALAQPRSVFGQSSPKAPSPQQLAKPPQPVDQEQFISYWTTEPGWNTELLLRNNLESSDLTVAPAVRTAAGVETALPSVTIKPGDVVSLDLYDTLMKTAPPVAGAWGSLVVRFNAITPSALYSSVMVRAAGRPFDFHLDAFGRGSKFETGSREGIWWLPSSTVTDYLILTNSGYQVLEPNLALYDSTGKAWQQKLNLSARQTLRLSIRSLLQQAGFSGSFGGIRLDMASGARYLDSAHLLFDESGGFSAIMKMFKHDPSTTPSSRSFGGVKEWTTRAPMLALSNPDPALGFPAGTTLQPKVFIRNASGKTFTAHVRFNWRSATTSGKSAPLDLTFKANETQLLDVAALQVQNLLPVDAQWAAVILSASVLPNEMLAVAASYDQTGRYGAQTPFNDQLATHWEGGKWEVDGTHNSLVTVANGGNTPAQAQLTILYNQGSGQYQLEQTLAPDEQMALDFSKLIHNQVPDKDGHTLPLDLTSGAYRVRDLNDNPLGSVYEGKVIVDKTYGHAAYGCMICCGPNNPWMTYDPLSVFVNDFEDQGVLAINSCTQRQVTVTSSFPTWWTGNTSIATASGYQINGVATGTTNNNAQSINMYWGPKTDNPDGCPLSQFQPSGGTNVVPTVTFGDTPLVPLGKPVPTTATVNPPTNTTPITLTISTTSGTGAATFLGGSTTMTITTTTSVTLVGVTASSAPYNMELDAKVGSTTVGSMIFTVTGTINGAIPVNYRQTAFSVQSSASLHFEYKWDSSTGNLADLSTCQIEEYVTYVGPNPYPWPSPPYLANQVTPWPFLGGTPISANNPVGLKDDHGHADGWQTPYVFKVVASDQVYQFQCPYYQNNQWVQLMPINGQIPIDRVVSLPNGNPPWTYTITKSGQSASMTLP